MRLYHHPFSSNARKAVMTAELLKQPIELVMIDLTKGEQRTVEYRKLNPNGKVPTLVDGEVIVWESLAIMMYLADKSPDNTLYPKGLAARAAVNQWLLWSASHFSPAISTLTFENMLKKMFGLGQPDAARVARVSDELKRLGEILDAHLALRTWVAGETLTLADISLACPLMYTERAALPVKDFANLQRWYARVQALEAWKKTA